jgi:hypothetical protein
MKNLFLLLGLGAFMGLLSTGCSLFGKGSEEQPSYQVIKNEENKEIRKYDSFIIAKTTINSNFKDAQGKGFRILAGYIFGKNKSQQKISMTAPVMTAPDDRENWTMTFNMPSKFTIKTLPAPTDERIKIEKVEQRLFAAITFSGLWDESKNEEEAKKLKDWLKKLPEYELISPAMFAAYNPPWTIPFLRRNEMLIELRIKKNVE